MKRKKNQFDALAIIVAIVIITAIVFYFWMRRQPEGEPLPEEAKVLKPRIKGNMKISSFATSKKLLAGEVYFDHRVTFYCLARYDADGTVKPPKGFFTATHKKRAKKIEWEHALPAEHFGRNFAEWTRGAPSCRDGKGKTYKGRKCAEKANAEFGYMVSDMYNLYPAIGAVNAVRSNLPYAEIGETSRYTFGSCPMTIEDGKAEPPPYTRGAIARTYLYFDAAYPQFAMSKAQRKLMERWNDEYPADEWECERAARIERIQGNANPFVKEKCE